jgi:cytochrome oxidase Cu insertion factor (SCO1/SenC/PrrC family)
MMGSMTRRRLLAAAAGAAMPGAGARANAPLDCDNRERDWFTNRVLTDQHGVRRRFYDDVLRGRTVLLGWIFTSCPDACPLLAARSLQIVDAALQGGATTPPRLVHLTTDPRRDRPERLKAWAARFGTYPDWVLLTGTAADLREVARRLGQQVEEANPERHTTLLLAGNVGARRWTKLRPDLPAPAAAVQLAELAGATQLADASRCVG